jgi:hypothetical protein
LGSNKKICKHNIENNSEEVLHLISKAFDSINAKFWQNCIKHWEINGITEETAEDLVINFGEDSDKDDWDLDF